MSAVEIALLALLIACVLGALGLLAVVGVLVVRRRRFKRIAAGGLHGVAPVPGRSDRGPPLPVVLVHGLFGFDRIGVPGMRFHYFRGIVKHLETVGCHAHAVRLPPADSVPDRARILVDKIAALPHERVDIIAHSLGGLDARYALAHLGLASKVRSLVTIGTPHRGTPLAHLASGGPLGIARKAVRLLGLPLDALDWLSPAALERFNQRVRDVPGVRYACVVGGIREARTTVSLTLVATHAYLRHVEGPNDGLVSMASQYWGETLAEIEADHLEQIGWRTPLRGTFDALGLYEYIVARLGDAPVVTAQARMSAAASVARADH
ncbi:MAG: esterase/lipase family protein [Kofleriaceae bacterium]